MVGKIDPVKSKDGFILWNYINWLLALELLKQFLVELKIRNTHCERSKPEKILFLTKTTQTIPRSTYNHCQTTVLRSGFHLEELFNLLGSLLLVVHQQKQNYVIKGQFTSKLLQFQIIQASLESVVIPEVCVHCFFIILKCKFKKKARVKLHGKVLAKPVIIIGQQENRTTGEDKYCIELKKLTKTIKSQA